MKSLVIEFLRFDNLDTGFLRTGDRYLVAAGRRKVREVSMSMEQADFFDLMYALRYQSDRDERLDAIARVSAVVNDLLGEQIRSELTALDEKVHVDLVVNARELAGLPFEMATDNEGHPLFVMRGPGADISRHERHDCSKENLSWPLHPRVLFAWANPPGNKVDVPHALHERALRSAIASAAETENLLTVLPDAGTEAIEGVCRGAEESGKPFDYVHLLAHGARVKKGHRERFGIALQNAATGERDVVAPERLAKALTLTTRKPVLVTLATCDSASQKNAMVPEGSVANELHIAGIAVVVAAQLPLTVSGSNTMVEVLYAELFAGGDIRKALHKVRVTLYEQRKRMGHDWASIVAYINSPERDDTSAAVQTQSIEDQLAAQMTALRNASALSEALVQRDDSQYDAPELPYKVVAQTLRERIGDLKSLLLESRQCGLVGVLEENLGLLGSTEKRLAELQYVRASAGQQVETVAVREALQRSRIWYRKAYRKQLSHHWTGVQYLSLDCLLDGELSNIGHWYSAVLAAKEDAEKEDEIWALGSAAELCLLATFANQPPQLDDARIALEKMIVRVQTQQPDDLFPLRSTQRQLQRYVNWWTNANGFFPGVSDLSEAAGTLTALLQEPIAPPPR